MQRTAIESAPDSLWRLNLRRSGAMQRTELSRDLAAIMVLISAGAELCSGLGEDNVVAIGEVVLISAGAELCSGPSLNGRAFRVGLNLRRSGAMQRTYDYYYYSKDRLNLRRSGAMQRTAWLVTN